MLDHHHLFSDKSELYRRARPRYPSALYDQLAELCPAHQRAWDVATGTGQVALDLPHYFNQIQATDISPSQLAQALAHRRVTYSLQSAEATGFAADSFDLVCVGQALHWFDLARFWPEVKRVLKPTGLLAVWGYSWFKIRPDIDRLLDQTVLRPIRPYWLPQNRLLWDHYRTIPFPFEQQPMPPIELAVSWTVTELFAYLHSWSATQRCLETEGASFFEAAYDQVASLWGGAAQKQQVVMDFCLIVGRNRQDQ